MKKKISAVQTTAEDILCDVCGSTVIPDGIRKQIDNMDNFSAYGKLTASARDGEEYHFHFCESCFDKVLSHVTKLQSL